MSLIIFSEFINMLQLIKFHKYSYFSVGPDTAIIISKSCHNAKTSNILTIRSMHKLKLAIIPLKIKLKPPGTKKHSQNTVMHTYNILSVASINISYKFFPVLPSLPCPPFPPPPKLSDIVIVKLTLIKITRLSRRPPGVTHSSRP